MAISSVGGQEPTEQVGTAVASPGGVSLPGSGSASIGEDTSGEGKPWATVGDQSFANQEEFSKWYDAQNKGEETTPGNDTLAGDSTTAGAGNDSLAGAESDDAIVARLKEAGGIYADERYAPFALEFEKTGDLSAESVKKAAEAFGIPESFVQEFVNNGKAAKAANTLAASQPNPEHVAMAAAIIEVIPEETNYRALLTWGKENLSADEQAAYDGALNRNDAATAKALLTGFQQRFNASGNGGAPRDVTTEGQGGGSSGGTVGYASSAEMQAAMRDPRYENDSAYRKEVERKVHASTF